MSSHHPSAVLAGLAFALGLVGSQALAQVIVDGATIAQQEPPPHGETGMSTARAFTRSVEDPALEVRERILHPGAQIGHHILTHDQVFYVRGGEARFVADGATSILRSGDLAYAFAGSAVSIHQTGAAPVTVLMAWPAASQLPAPGPALVVDEGAVARDEPTPFGSVGMTRVHEIFPPHASRQLDMRKRVYQTGAKLGRHVIPRDQIFYAVSGQGLLEVNGAKHALVPGRAVYVTGRSEIALAQSGAEPLSVVMVWPAAGLDLKAPNAVIVREAEVTRQEPPHGGIGMSTVSRLTDAIAGRSIELRKRVLEPGSQLSPYVIPRDQALYFVGGRGQLVVDGKDQAVSEGQFAYLPKGSRFSLAPTTSVPLSVVMTWSLAKP